MMPDPIRTGLILPPALLDDLPDYIALTLQKAACIGQPDNTLPDVEVQNSHSPCVDDGISTAFTSSTVTPVESRPGMPIKWDPYGRDAPRPNLVKDWSVEPLLKYTKSVVLQINANLQDKRLPSAEKLDSFVARIVSHTQRQLKHAPRKVRHTLQGIFSKKFQKFWNYVRNERVRATTPDELKDALLRLVEALTEFASSHDAIEQPRPIRCVPNIIVACS